jgi:hypothetical protein
MAPPHGVTAAGHEVASQAAARVLSMTVGSGMARLIAETAAYRLSGPRLQNTDGDPMVLVKATLTVDDLDAVTGRLASYPDIVPDEETPGGSPGGAAHSPRPSASPPGRVSRSGLSPPGTAATVQAFLAEQRRRVGRAACRRRRSAVLQPGQPAGLRPRWLCPRAGGDIPARFAGAAGPRTA